MISKVKIEDAVGLVLAHDCTKVVPGGFKGPVFRRNHIIQAEDIPGFHDIGKDHVYVLELEAGEVHEEEAALQMAQAISGYGLVHTRPREGRVDLVAKQAGLIKVNEVGLNRINRLGELIVATVHNNTLCREGMTVAGMRIIPLYTRQEKLDKVREIAQKYHPVITLLPLKYHQVGMVITGNEVFRGNIKDGFSPVLHRKVEALGCTINNEAILPDDADMVAQTIQEFKASGSEVIICTGGMSVDPDDVTPEGIRRSGARIRFYGLPVLPGAMFLYARLKQTSIIGAPACVLHAPTTAFDVLFPRVLAGEELTFAGTRQLGHGGLCLGCQPCHFPVCPLGK